MSSLADLSDRARTVFAQVVEEYLSSGSPVGSKTLAQLPGGQGLSSASIRAVLAELESAGLLSSPHTSAGRLPTDGGLRLFVDGMVEWSAPDAEERAAIEAQVRQITKIETALAPRFQEHFVAANAIPHATAPFANLASVVTLPEVSFNTGSGGGGGGRRRRQR